MGKRISGKKKKKLIRQVKQSIAKALKRIKH